MQEVPLLDYHSRPIGQDTVDAAYIQLRHVRRHT